MRCIRNEPYRMPDSTNLPFVWYIRTTNDAAAFFHGYYNCRSCTESWVRTNDLMRMKHPLYQLSYLGVCDYREIRTPAWISPISFADCCLRPLDHIVIVCGAALSRTRTSGFSVQRAHHLHHCSIFLTS